MCNRNLNNMCNYNNRNLNNHKQCAVASVIQKIQWPS